jgi:GMP synthase (glutamine-hydrolysing)
MNIAELIHDADHLKIPSNADQWAESLGARTKRYNAFTGEYPELRDTDLLILHGGAQHVWDKASDPWLYEEIAFIRRAAELGVPVVGFCLGSQLIAEAFGGKAYSADKETGFYRVSPAESSAGHPLLAGLEAGFDTFLWHEDHFTLPRFTSLASTDAAPNQLVACADVPAVGIQSHPEYTKQMIRFYVQEHPDEPWVLDGVRLSADDFASALSRRPDTYSLFARLMKNTLAYFRGAFPARRLLKDGG